jgi:hypothetical protein
VSAFPTRILDQDLEAEAERPVRLQVVAGSRFELAADWGNVSGNFALHVLVAPGSDGACGQEPSDTAGENVVVTETRVRVLNQKQIL